MPLITESLQGFVQWSPLIGRWRSEVCMFTSFHIFSAADSVTPCCWFKCLISVLKEEKTRDKSECVCCCIMFTLTLIYPSFISSRDLLLCLSVFGWSFISCIDRQRLVKQWRHTGEGWGGLHHLHFYNKVISSPPTLFHVEYNNPYK